MRAGRAEDRLAETPELAGQADLGRVTDGRAAITGVGEIQAGGRDDMAGQPDRVAGDRRLDALGGSISQTSMMTLKLSVMNATWLVSTAV